jgi:hypothetical protein
MIEAVENHNPEVIVIDEIGRELETAAARTIAERGVQLIGTAHGNTIDNLMLNPTLSDLVGGIEAVTLSDEEARRRGTQKTVLERRAPATFDVLVEIQTRDRLAVHLNLSESVDSLLRGYPLPPEIRSRDASGNIQIEKPPASARNPSEFRIESNTSGPRHSSMVEVRTPTRPEIHREINPYQGPEQADLTTPHSESHRVPLNAVRVYPYGVARNRLMQAAKRLGVPALVENDASHADVLVTLKTHYRSRQQTVMDAEHRGVPIYVLRANTVTQMEQFLSNLFNLAEFQPMTGEMEDVQAQTQAAIAAVLNGEHWVDLPPSPSTVRRIQHEMARQAELVSHSYGKEPRRRVRIFRE